MFLTRNLYQLSEYIIIAELFYIKLFLICAQNTRLVTLQQSDESVTLRLILKGKAIPLQALTGPEGSSRLRLLDFKKIGT
jgi:hypothetical protein